MDQLFLTLLDMSRAAGWVVLAVLLLRLLLKKAPNALRCALWSMVALRLLCPVSLESPMSLLPQTQPVSQESLSEPVLVYIPGTLHVEAYHAPEETDLYVSGTPFPYSPGASAPTAGAPVHTSLSTLDTLDILTGVWLLGLTGMLIYAAASYLRIRRRVSANIPLSKDVFLCDYIQSPFILGFLRPRIYLPSDMDPGHASQVLAHERSHLRRRDHWWKPLGFLLLSVYWFHPLLWVAYLLLCRDIELACDEAVIRDFSPAEKKAYSEALLSCSINRGRISACPLAFGENGIKQRVASVLHYRKPSFWLLLVSVTAALLTALCVLTDPDQSTLTDLVPVSRQDIVCIDLSPNKGHTCLSAPQDISDALAFLEETEYDPQPVSQERRESAVDENQFSYPTLVIQYPQSTLTYFFTWDYTQVWCSDGVKPTFPYPVKNPEAVSAYFNSHSMFFTSDRI